MFDRIKRVLEDQGNGGRPWNVVAPEKVALHRKVQRFLFGFAEHAAGEAFRWVGWAVVLGTVRAVRYQTGNEWLLALEVVLAFLILARMLWRLTILAPEVENPDGSITIQVSRRQMLVGFLVAVLCWGMAWVLAVWVAGVIAEAELLRLS